MFGFRIVAQQVINTQNLPQVSANSTEIGKVLDIVFQIAGAIALLVITLAGFRYITSRGDPQAIAQAKNAILYAAIGLVVCVLAIAIVNFIVNSTSG